MKETEKSHVHLRNRSVEEARWHETFQASFFVFRLNQNEDTFLVLHPQMSAVLRQWTDS